MRILQRTFGACFGVLVLNSMGCTTEPKAVGIAALAGGTQSGIAGSAAAVTPSVKVIDGSGKGVSGVAVEFTIGTGGGAVVGGSSSTNADGIATVGTWTLGKTVATNTLIATASGLTGSPVTFTATTVAGPAASILANTGSAQTATVGTAVSTAPSVKVADVNGNAVSGAVVTFAATAGGGAVTGATQTTSSTGIATVGGWTLGLTSGTNTLTASAAGLSGAALITATGAAGAATQVAIVTQPTAAVNNVAFSTQPVVQIRDANNNLVTTATNSVTAAVATGTGTLGGTFTVAAIGGVATFTNLVLTGITSTGAVTLTFTGTGLTAATSASFATFAVAPVNLTIDGLYLTQATQNYLGTVPLIAGRAGLVRVFVKAAQTNTVAPAVRVRLYKAGVVVQTYTIVAPTTSVPTAVDEATLTSSWNVSIPALVMETGLSILADVDPAGLITELSETDNSFPVSGVPQALDVRVASTFNLTFVPVVQPGVAQGDVTDANKAGYMDYPMRVYPFSSYDALVHAPYSYSQVLLGSSYDSTWTNLLSQMNALRIAEGSTRYYFGVIKPGYTSGGTGFGYIGLPAAVGVDWQGTVQPTTNYRSMTAAHEWGHNFNRRHVNCGGPSSPDPSYPYTPTSIGVYGYDIVLSAARSTTLADFMSYCQPLWISDYTYKAVLDYRALGNAPSVAAAPQRGILVWGHVGLNGVVLEPSFEIDAPPSLPTQAGPYSVQATDDAGREIFNLSFEGTEIDHAPNERHFAFVVPLAVTAPMPATLRLIANGRESIRRRIAPSAAGGASTSLIASARLSVAAGTRSRLEWDASGYPMALVRDPATGEILSFARGGQIDIDGPGRDLDVTFSDGVGSVRRLVRITPR